MIASRSVNRFSGLMMLYVGLMLVGCKTELYGGLSEKEANEMYAILHGAGISVEKLTEKETQKGRIATLRVEEAQSAAAIQLLKNHGYPKEQFTNLGDVFSKEGIISSPVEEQARLIYALSQEVSSTLSQIDGVLTARVHIVMPEKSEFGEKTAPPSASVFIKHIADVEVENLKAKIKELVANSIHELSANRVSVAFFSAQPALADGSISVERSFFSGITLLLSAIALVLVAGVAAFGGYYLYRQKQQNTFGAQEAVGSV